MKLFLFVIFNLIDFNLILSKNLKSSDIFKEGDSKKFLNSKKYTKPINTKNDSSLKDQKDLEEQYDSEYQKFGEFEGESKSEENYYHDDEPLIDYLDDNVDNTEEQLKKRTLFIAYCLKGGLTSDEQILNAYNWALKNKYLRNDKYKVKELSKNISNQFKSTFHKDWKIIIHKKGSSYIIKENKFIVKADELRRRANGKKLKILYKNKN